MSSTSARCPLCAGMDSIYHIALRCPHPTMNGMHTDRYHVGLSMDACQNERLLEQGIEVPENISRAIPDWVFPNCTGSFARHQSRPDAIFVCSIPGWSAHLDPTNSS
eukprot:1155146-Pelagomonas_calceolata.AAC.7